MAHGHCRARQEDAAARSTGRWCQADAAGAPAGRRAARLHDRRFGGCVADVSSLSDFSECNRAVVVVVIFQPRWPTSARRVLSRSCTRVRPAWSSCAQHGPRSTPRWTGEAGCGGVDGAGRSRGSVGCGAASAERRARSGDERFAHGAGERRRVQRHRPRPASDDAGAGRCGPTRLWHGRPTRTWRSSRRSRRPSGSALTSRLCSAPAPDTAPALTRHRPLTRPAL